MYYLIIGYGDFTPSLINFLSTLNKTIFIIDSKSPESINITKRNVFYFQKDITDMSILTTESQKNTISKIYISTNNDYLNLMIADNIFQYKDTTVLFKSNIAEKLIKNQYKSLFIGNILEQFLLKGDVIC